MKDWKVLTEHELVALEQSSGDDCDMAAVRCAVRELRARRAADLSPRDIAALAHARLVVELANSYDPEDPAIDGDALAILDKLTAGRAQ